VFYRDASRLFIVVYYETIKRETKIKPNSECRCDERLKSKVEVDEKFASVMGECVI